MWHRGVLVEVWLRKVSHIKSHLPQMGSTPFANSLKVSKESCIFVLAGTSPECLTVKNLLNYGKQNNF